MVAYTSPYCLPYLEGTDSLCLNTGTVCEPSTAWCDLITLVEAQLDAFDAVTARTGRSVPLARISYNPTTLIALPNNTIPFDSVDIDTDNMADLTLFNGIQPNRNGIYEILLEVNLHAQIPGGVQHVYSQIRVGNETFPTVLGSEFGVAYGAVVIQPGNDGSPTLSCTALWEFNSSTPVPRTVFATVDSTTALVKSAALTVLWHSETT